VAVWHPRPRDRVTYSCSLQSISLSFLSALLLILDIMPLPHLFPFLSSFSVARPYSLAFTFPLSLFSGTRVRLTPIVGYGSFACPRRYVRVPTTMLGPYPCTRPVVPKRIVVAEEIREPTSLPRPRRWSRAFSACDHPLRARVARRPASRSRRTSCPRRSKRLGGTPAAS